MLFFPLRQEPGKFEQKQKAECALRPDEIHRIFELLKVRVMFDCHQAEVFARAGFCH